MKRGESHPRQDNDQRDMAPPAAALDEHEAVREKIKALIQRSGRDGYASVSALLGRSHSYIQQYVARRSPKSLRESDRRKIARHFGIPESELLLPGELKFDGELVVIPPWRATAKDEHRDNGGHEAQPFRRAWLDMRFGSPPSAMAMMAISGDGMTPTLYHGDQVLVDTKQTGIVSDGLYMLEIGGQTRARRITTHPATGQVIISADNPLYPAVLECHPKDVQVVGRIVWVGHCL